MEFLKPAMLWGLIGIAIPIAIHLLQLKRYKTVYFSDIRFLKNVQKTARKQHQIRHWLVLATRILAWSILTIAFALPFFPSEGQEKKHRNDIILFVDNSPSMTLRSGDAALWVNAVDAAHGIVENNPNATFHVLTANNLGKDVVALSATAANKPLNEIRPSNASISWEDVARRISTYSITDTAQLFMLTDAQTNSVVNVEALQLPVEVVPVLFSPTVEVANLQIDSAWIESPVLLPKQNVEVHYTLQNNGSENSETNLELWVNGELRGAKAHEIDAEGQLNSSISFSAPRSGVMEVEMRIEDAGLQFDNAYYLSASTRDHLNVLHIASTSFSSIELAAILSDTTVNVDKVSFEKIPFGRLSEYDLIVADQNATWPSGLASALNAALESGSSVLVFPKGPKNDDLAVLGIAPFTTTDTTRLTTLTLNPSDDFYKGVFYEAPKTVKFPVVTERSPISSTYRAYPSQALLSFGNGEPNLLRYEVGAGQVYQWSTHPVQQQIGWSDLYTVILYQMAIYKGRADWNALYLSDINNVTLRSKLTGAAASIVRDSISVIPQQIQRGSSLEMSVTGNAFNAGFAYVVDNTDSIYTLAFNTRLNESELERFNSDNLQEYLRNHGVKSSVYNVDSNNDITQVLKAIDGEEQDSKYWILAVIAVLLLEMILWRKPKS